MDVNRWYVDDEGREYHGSVLRHVGLLPPFIGPRWERREDAASVMLHLRAK